MQEMKFQSSDALYHQVPSPTDFVEYLGGLGWALTEAYRLPICLGKRMRDSSEVSTEIA
jgi:hypothetical protein